MRKLNQRGQGMTEYIILVALIAIAAIAAVKFFGKATADGFNDAAKAVGGATSGAGGGSSVGNDIKDAAVGVAVKQGEQGLQKLVNGKQE